MMQRRKTYAGSALVVVMIFVVIFGALTAGYLSAAGANLRAARMYADSRRAHLAAESGLRFVCRRLPEIDIEGTTTSAETLQAIASGLNDRFGDTLFDGQTAVADAEGVLLPAIILNFPEGQATFQARVVALSDSDYRVQCCGSASQCARTVSAGFGAMKDSSFLAAFGVASRSRIKMTGNAHIEGANDDKEGSILSATYSTTTAIDMTGNIDISGDVSVTNPDGEVRMVGNSHIGGDILIGVAEPQFPEVDTTAFEPYAANVVGPGTPTSGNRYFENVRILANTNPTFSGNITVRGLVYIESPNQVKFTGNLNLVGVVVVEPPPGELDLSNHSIKFTGNTSTDGVGSLPSDPQFDGLRDLDGSFILAPGYAVEFTGNFSTINGSMVSSQFKFTGNAGGTINGSLVNLDDTDFVMTGNSHLTINHDGMDEDPAGIEFPRQLAYVAGSYCE